MDPVVENITRSLEAKLSKGAPAGPIYLAALAEVTEALVQLDMGMIGGLALKRERLESLTAEAVALATRCFEGAVTHDPKKTARWASSRPVYGKPRSLDLDAWATIAAATPSPAAPAVAIDLGGRNVPKVLADVLRQLVARAAAEPGLHLLAPPASDDEIDAREEEMGVKLSSELRVLYRLCNGFSLFRGHAAGLVDESPFRLVTLEELQPFAFTVGEEIPDDDPPTNLAEAIEDPSRLQVFDVGNGEFVSCAVRSGKPVWIDDYSDGPQRALTRSLHVLLTFVLAPARTAEGTRPWESDVWEGLHAS